MSAISTFCYFLRCPGGPRAGPAVRPGPAVLLHKYTAGGFPTRASGSRLRVKKQKEFRTRDFSFFFAGARARAAAKSGSGCICARAWFSHQSCLLISKVMLPPDKEDPFFLLFFYFILTKEICQRAVHVYQPFNSSKENADIFLFLQR